MDKFAGIKTGTLVKRSRHWYKIHKSWPRGQVGIVTDRYLCTEGCPVGEFVTYPYVHWEGEHMSSMTHPMNLEIARSKYRK